MAEASWADHRDLREIASRMAGQAHGLHLVRVLGNSPMRELARIAPDRRLMATAAVSRTDVRDRRGVACLARCRRIREVQGVVAHPATHLRVCSTESDIARVRDRLDGRPSRRGVARTAISDARAVRVYARVAGSARLPASADRRTEVAVRVAGRAGLPRVCTGQREHIGVVERRRLPARRRMALSAGRQTAVRGAVASGAAGRRAPIATSGVAPRARKRLVVPGESEVRRVVERRRSPA